MQLFFFFFSIIKYYLICCSLICDTQFAGEIVKTMLKLSEPLRDPLSPTSQTVSLYEVFNTVYALFIACIGC